jgi:hypothetical protein
MRHSFIVAGVFATSIGISVTPILHSIVWAQGTPPSGQADKSGQGAQSSQGGQLGAQPSITDVTGQLKTDTGKTEDDVKAMDVNKAQQDAGQVNKDVQGIEDSAKGLLTNPFGK